MEYNDLVINSGDNILTEMADNGETLESFEDTLQNYIDSELDNALIYYDDQWDLMKEYQTPQEANWNEAVELFYNDLWQYCEEHKEDYLEHEEEEEEENE